MAGRAAGRPERPAGAGSARRIAPGPAPRPTPPSRRPPRSPAAALWSATPPQHPPEPDQVLLGGGKRMDENRVDVLNRDLAGALHAPALGQHRGHVPERVEVGPGDRAKSPPPYVVEPHQEQPEQELRQVPPAEGARNVLDVQVDAVADGLVAPKVTQRRAGPHHVVVGHRPRLVSGPPTHQLGAEAQVLVLQIGEI